MKKGFLLKASFLIVSLCQTAQQPITKKLIFVDAQNQEFEIDLSDNEIQRLISEDNKHSYLYGLLASLASENEIHIQLPKEIILTENRKIIMSNLIQIAQLSANEINVDAEKRLKLLAALKKNSIQDVVYDLEELVYLADFLGYEHIARFYAGINGTIREYELFLVSLKDFADNKAKQYAAEMYLLKQVNPIISLGTVRYLYTLIYRYLLCAEIFSQTDIHELLMKVLEDSEDPSLMMVNVVLKFAKNGTLAGMEDDLKTLFMKLVHFVNKSYALEFQSEEYDDLTSIFYRLLMSLGLSSTDQDIYWSISDTIEV